MTMDDHHPPEELPADLLARLRAPVEVDSEIVDAQVVAALSEMDAAAVPFRRARGNHRRWLPVAAAIVAVLTVGGAILASWQSSPTGTADQASRNVESLGAGGTEDRAEPKMPEPDSGADIEMGTGAELAPRLPGPSESVPQEGVSPVDGAPTGVPKPMSGEVAMSAPTSCPTGNWWDTIRALFGRCA